MSSLVSVVIPSYNRPQAVRNAIGTVFSQTLNDIELIVVDDHSTPPLAEALKDITDKRLTIIRHEINKGVSEARNTGIKNAHGAWVAFLDDDDAWAPEKLERQLAFATGKENGADACVADIFEPPSGIHYKFSKIVRQKGVARTLIHWEGLPPSTWLVRRSVFEDVGLFDSSLVRAEDWDWLLRFYIKGHALTVLPEECVTYAGNHGSAYDTDTSFIERVVEKNRTNLRRAAGMGAASFLEIFLYQKTARAAIRTQNAPRVVLYFARAALYWLRALVFSPMDALKYFYETLEKNKDIPRRLGALAKNWGASKRP